MVSAWGYILERECFRGEGVTHLYNFYVEVAFVLRKVDKGEWALLKARATEPLPAVGSYQRPTRIDCKGERHEVRTQLGGFYSDTQRRKHQYARTHVQRRILRNS